MSILPFDYLTNRNDDYSNSAAYPTMFPSYSEVYHQSLGCSSATNILNTENANPQNQPSNENIIEVNYSLQYPTMLS